MLVEYLIKTKKGYKNLKKRKIQDKFIQDSTFTYSTCGIFIKNRERTLKFKETEDSRYIYQNGLDKACFQHDMAYRGFKDLSRRKILVTYCVIKHLILLKIQNILDINVDLL